ncbi:MAG: TetR/AcrR family transcriptional regulator [Ignavibacteriales bacterium]|nr:MAG: TetR/AcrR family transcriptional regulator [Ignavibacteriales bacterium]
METDRKTRIIKTAVKRFARHGLNKTTLDEIARDLRIGKSTIYHYFESKEALFYQTLEYDALLYIDDVKQIFNNEQISFKERLLEYLFYKQEIYNKYKLLYDLIIRVLKEECLETEKEILKKLLLEEENLLKLVLNNFYSIRIELMNPGMPEFFVMQSWGILFSKKLNDIREDSTTNSYKELLLTCLDNVIA